MLDQKSHVAPQFSRLPASGWVGLFALALVLTPTSHAGADDPGKTNSSNAQYRVELKTDGSGWNVFEGDELVAGYLFDSNGKPVVFPLLSRDGHRLTRNYPIKPSGPNEKQDHVHHRSMWLTHGDVNGIDFWIETTDDGSRGTIKRREGSATIDPETGEAVILTSNDWLAPDGHRVLSDERRFAFRTTEEQRVIDCDFRLTASDGDVNFGDTKEGTFGIRVAGTMKVDAKLGGTITNAEGINGQDAWGLPSAWVDYSGPVDDETAGITVHNHPSSHAYPCRWHVRTYGLFAANPFGVYHFVGGEKTDGFTLPAGESITLSFRVVLHHGEFDVEQAAADFEAYSATPRPTAF